MTDNVRKVFDLLGIEPNEKFKLILFGLKDTVCYLNQNLQLVVLNEKENKRFVEESVLGDMLLNPQQIIKLPKEPKKKKLRDLTNDEYTKWKVKNCVNVNRDCTNCMFRNANCSSTNLGWVNNKEVYSDTFLDQEIEVEE